MRPYPLLLEIALKICKIFACLIPHKNVRQKLRRFPFVCFHRLYLMVKRNNAKNTIKANVFISAGNACKPALHLRNYGLRKLSCPFDWIMNYDLREFYRCFEVEFSDFFANCYEAGDKTNNTQGKERWVVSASNAGAISIHAFPKSMSLESYLPTFREKMQKRFNRLKRKILDSTSVAFVCVRTDSLEDLADFGKKFITLCESWQICQLQNASDKNERERESKIRVIIINVRHKEKIPKTSITKQIHNIDENVSIVEFICNDTSINPKQHYLGNTYAWHKIMLQLQLA